MEAKEKRCRFEIEVVNNNGKTEIMLSGSGEIRGADQGSVILTLGRSFGFGPGEWMAVAMAGAAGEQAIGGKVTREITMGGHRPMKEEPGPGAPHPAAAPPPSPRGEG